MRRRRRLLLVASALALVLATPGRSEDPAPEDLTAEQRVWLAEVAPLITEQERAAFLSLDRPHRRDAFIAAFWRARDPFPETTLNEFEEVWSARREMVRTRFGNLDDDRGSVLLLVGPPDSIDSAPCPDRLAEIEIWHFIGRERATGRFDVVFDRGVGRYRLWSPRAGLHSLVQSSELPLGGDHEIRQRFLSECVGGSDLLTTLERALDWGQIEEASSNPRPSGEWVATFLSRSTDLPDAAETFEATLTVTFPGRNQSRTVVQGLISVPVAEARAGEGGDGSFQFLVDGEVLLDDRLFEDFRYRFDLPSSELSDGRIPLVLQRYLRPGDYRLVVKVRDLVADAFYRVERDLRVPRVASGGRASEAPLPGRAVTEAPRTTGSPVAGADDLLAEANQALEAADQRLTLVAPLDELLTGAVRIQARAAGSRIAKVAFLLNGRTVMSKSRAPYSVEINLGHAPRLHVVEARGYDAQGREIARDRVSLNAGPHRFGIRLREPLPGGRYRRSLRAAAEVSLPLGSTLDRVEIFLNETRLATLFQPPFVQPIILPEAEGLAYVRAVAYLDDGNSTEDLVFVNAPESLERIEIDFVELYTSVVDRRGRPVEGLEKGDFEVLEDGEPQRILRFERVRDLPIYAGVVIDTSTSMAEELRDAERAALSFLERVIEPEDRAAVFVFADEPNLRVPLTNNLDVLAGGLSGMVAEGETALFDSVVESVFYFAGIKGKRALILLTDGHDSTSRHTFDEALEFAQRSGIAIYAIGIALASSDHEVRNVLARLARETGGEAFFVDRASQLDRIYARVEEELRSQYLLGYQSPQTESTRFRVTEVRLRDSELRAKSIPGYYP